MKLQVTKEHIRTFGILAAVGAVSILITTITNRSICIFYNTTGVPCPSCGMTRAFSNLINGDVRGAFWYHPLFPIVPFIPFILYSKKKVYLYGAIFLIIAIWIARLALFYPKVAPMVYLESNYFEYIRDIVLNLLGK